MHKSEGEGLKLINKKTGSNPGETKYQRKHSGSLLILGPTTTLFFKKLAVTKGDTTQTTIKVNPTKDAYGHDAQADKAGVSLINNIHQYNQISRIALNT